MAKVTIKFGAGNELTKQFDAGTSVGDIINDDAIQSNLGFGDDVEGYVDGAAVGEDYQPREGQVVSLRTRANTKG